MRHSAIRLLLLALLLLVVANGAAWQYRRLLPAPPSPEAVHAAPVAAPAPQSAPTGEAWIEERRDGQVVGYHWGRPPPISSWSANGERVVGDNRGPAAYQPYAGGPVSAR